MHTSRGAAPASCSPRKGPSYGSTGSTDCHAPRSPAGAMQMDRKKWSRYLIGVAMAVVSFAIASLAIASSVEILNPGQINGQLSLGAETVTSFQVNAYSADGFQANQTFTTSPYSL